MPDRRRTSTTLVASSGAVVAAHAAVAVLELARPASTPRLSPIFALGFFVAACAFLASGTAVLSRWPRHRMGAVFFAIGVSFSLGAAVEQAVVRVEWAGPLGPIAQSLNGIGLALLVTLVPLWYPDGRLPSRRWRPPGSGTIVTAVLPTGPLQPASDG